MLEEIESLGKKILGICIIHILYFFSQYLRNREKLTGFSVKNWHFSPSLVYLFFSKCRRRRGGVLIHSTPLQKLEKLFEKKFSQTIFPRNFQTVTYFFALVHFYFFRQRSG